ncbi:hypothetical protein [Amycolatopsis sp. CA-128772]|uniref:hypothetical protein n=1 Tax=Amycolatopsis sp. CA-128772 TaxID=2073159 RepID=UPI000CD270A9|nr:hypothetical protein [Amycolatopsis sp. CA-128772]
MKLMLTPTDGGVFEPVELRDQLALWVRDGARGKLTASCTITGKVKAVLIETDDAVPPAAP